MVIFFYLYLHFTEVVQLHSRTEVQKHVGQVRTLVGQFMENGVCDHLDGKLNVPQRRSKTMAEKLLDSINCLVASFRRHMLCNWLDVCVRWGCIATRF
jgi:L-serine deaminase